MEGLVRFLDMGGYAAFVWPAYGAAFAVLGGLAVASVRGLRASERALAELEAAGADRRRPRGRGADGGVVR